MNLRCTRFLWLVPAATAVCQASTNAPANLAMPGTGASAALSLIRVLGALGLVFAAFFGGLWLFRNWEKLCTNRNRASKLAVVEAKALGQRQTLYVIGYGRERMLVAASPAGVSLLTALPAAETEEPLPATEPVTSRSLGFGALLAQVAARKP